MGDAESGEWTELLPGEGRGMTPAAARMGALLVFAPASRVREDDPSAEGGPNPGAGPAGGRGHRGGVWRAGGTDRRLGLGRGCQVWEPQR